MGLLRRLTRSGALAVVVSTHDLELALRTADVVWLLLPGGEVVTGAPEDVILSGGIATAFEGRQIRFHPEERRFPLARRATEGTAAVRGDGLPAAMARAVLEREGYALVVEPTTRDSLSLTVVRGGMAPCPPKRLKSAVTHSGRWPRTCAACPRVNNEKETES